jgi:ATPase family associated with various cellular activities (AAA)
MDKQQFIREALCLPTSAIDYHVSQHLSEHFPTKGMIEGNEGLFNIEEYASSGQCTFEFGAIVYDQVVTRWNAPRLSSPPWMGPAALQMMGQITPGQSEAQQQLFDRSKNAWLTVTWNGSIFDVVVMNWRELTHSNYHYWILADSEERARDLMLAVCQWNAEVRGEVLVFSGGCWQKDPLLFQGIKNSTFDNLILKGSLKQDIREDLEQFFAARSVYERYNIPWKRGIIFIGPPGNGKTHAVKAILNVTRYPCLYVKSFNSEYGTDESNIHTVFERARQTAPCVLVLEDLDSLLTSQNRSNFLNELDGFATNVGIVTLATTNHPERLDPSILDRPSRFDRKYPFDLPEPPERLAYIIHWNASLEDTLRISDEVAAELSVLTEGFSFAYLKELFLSSMMRWISQPQQGTMEEVMKSQVTTLREQMASTQTQAEESQENDNGVMASQMTGRRGIRVYMS